ncbi:tetratricopeptide repeat protein [Gracilibacillus alcaliphilus]|uniref:tetratricopeptide repeat protein n=1 Tax=Gracilibacillus alcaliphilus TaxID=1401441 RepID=UPI00195A8FB8|nr:tetratricopeptide repeat protein [Gracilibacillus alcaliphilus]MBM7677474.1 tetratricopeptide (TPR) repeat protein [Gracilibacillus alcaliphilus]
MKTKILILCAALLALMTGCSLLSSTDTSFPRDEYDNWYAQEQFDTALADINQRLEDYPEDAYLLNEKGYILNELERYEEAQKTLEEAVEIDDQSDSAYTNLALSLNELGEYEQAIVAAQKAIDISENEPEQFINMGNAHSMLERDEKALEYYDKALEIDPTTPYGLYGKGVTLYFLEEFEDSIPYLEQYLDIFPNDVDAIRYIVYANDILENFESTIPYIDQLIELEPERQIDNLDYKGLMLIYAGQLDEAEAFYTEMTEAFPDEGVGYYGQSTALIQQGEIEEGLAKLEEAIELNIDLRDIAYSDPLFEPVYENDTFIELTE